MAYVIRVRYCPALGCGCYFLGWRAMDLTTGATMHVRMAMDADAIYLASARVIHTPHHEQECKGHAYSPS